MGVKGLIKVKTVSSFPSVHYYFSLYNKAFISKVLIGEVTSSQCHSRYILTPSVIRLIIAVTVKF